MCVSKKCIIICSTTMVVLCVRCGNSVGRRRILSNSFVKKRRKNEFVASFRTGDDLNMI